MSLFGRLQGALGWAVKLAFVLFGVVMLVRLADNWIEFLIGSLLLISALASQIYIYRTKRSPTEALVEHIKTKFGR